MTDPAEKLRAGSTFRPPKMPKDGTLRDWFAGLAMQTILRDINLASSPESLVENVIIPQLAKNAYRIADSMMKERAK